MKHASGAGAAGARSGSVPRRAADRREAVRERRLEAHRRRLRLLAGMGAGFVLVLATALTGYLIFGGDFGLSDAVQPGTPVRVSRFLATAQQESTTASNAAAALARLTAAPQPADAVWAASVRTAAQTVRDQVKQANALRAPPGYGQGLKLLLAGMDSYGHAADIAEAELSTGSFETAFQIGVAASVGDAQTSQALSALVGH